MGTVRLVEHANIAIAKSHETVNVLLDSETGLRGFLITGKEDFLEPYIRSTRTIDQEINILQDLVKNDQGQVQRLIQIKSIYQGWQNYAQDVIESKRQGRDDYLKRALSGDGKKPMDEIRDLFHEFIREKVTIRDERAEVNNETIRLVIFVILSISIITAISIAFYSRRQLKSLSGLFGTALQKQTELNNLLQQEDWHRTGLSKLNDLTRGDVSLSELSSRIINHLAYYTGAQVGAFYVVSEEEGVLQRVSTHAFSSEAEAKLSKLKLNEGLVGQAAAENRLIQVANLPQNYIQITSSLGAAIPRALVIAPASVEGSVKAVIELGFLNVPEPRVIELLEKASLGVAITVRTWKDRTLIQDLLEESRTFNEELQAQQEELRTSNEELLEQSRSLQDSRAELEQNNDALKNTQTLLEERSDQVLKASQYKSEFLANMSHELRTPLNSSLILSKLLADNAKGNLSPEQIQFANSIYSSGNDLLNLINDILDLSKVEAGMLEIRPENVFLPKVLKGLEHTFDALAQQKKLRFEIKLDPDVPETIITDRQRLEQILKNMLSNAFKFTEQGQVTIHLSRGTNQGLSMAVIDTGIGVPIGQQKLIFLAFHQADGTTGRKYGGTGLGLSISRDLAQLLGGSIEVESTPGIGSRFTLHLPLTVKESHPAILATKEIELQAMPVSARRNILASNVRTLLVIEDDPKFAQILCDLGHEFHYKCVVAHDAKEGLELAKTLLPNAVLLDIRLPDYSGLMVLDQFKENTLTRHIPVHIVSGHDYMVKALQMGAIGYIHKPSNMEELRSAFAKFESKLSSRMKRVLIVEDDQVQRDSMVKLIASPDLEITSVALAKDALDALKKNVYDCIVIDLKLPDMSGEQLLKEMNEQEEISSLPPVIVYTGRSLSLTEEDQLRKYSRSIIIKGARSPERLLDEVSLFLHQVDAKLTPERRQILKTVRSRQDVYKGKKILVVDDDARNLFALTAALEQKGANILIAKNGREALACLEAEPLMDLVLMDIMMPEMDGFQATREIRKQKRFAKLPIIAVTAKAAMKDQILCMEAGASDYLAKPIDLHNLFSLLRIWMPELGKE